VGRDAKLVFSRDALPPPPEAHYTPLQVAGAHQFSVSTVIGFIESGELSARKAGKEYRIPVSAYQAWLKKTETCPV